MTLEELQEALGVGTLERGYLLRPLGNVLYAMPPYCVTDGEATELARAMVEIVRETV